MLFNEQFLFRIFNLIEVFIRSKLGNSGMAELCTTCGMSINEDFAAFQRANLDADAGDPMCRSCIKGIETQPQIQSAFDTIEDALDAEAAAEWRALDFDEKFFRFLKLHQDGVITPADTLGKRKADFGSMALLQLVRRKCLQLMYDEDY